MLGMIGPQSAYKLNSRRRTLPVVGGVDYSAAFRRFVAESVECRIAVNVVV